MTRPQAFPVTVPYQTHRCGPPERRARRDRRERRRSPRTTPRASSRAHDRDRQNLLQASSAEPPCRRRLAPTSRRRLSTANWRYQDHEPTHLLHRRVPECVVTSYWSFVCTVRAWETAEPPTTGLDGGSGSSNGATRPSGRRSRTPLQRRPAPRLTVEDDGLRPRPAAGAASRSPREAADRFQSGARPPAGTEPGNRPVPRRPASRPSRSSSDAWKSESLRRRRGGTGPGCSPSWCNNWRTGESTTATSSVCLSHWMPY
jgi:hypothetical protein